MLGLKAKEPEDPLGALIAASFGVVAPVKGGTIKRINPTGSTIKPTSSIGTSSSHTALSSTIQSSGSSDPTGLSYQTNFSSSSKGGIRSGKYQLSDKERLEFDFNPDILANLRDKPVADLSGHVKDVSIRPVFEGVYSNVWTGKLNGAKKVNGPLLVRILLTHDSQVAIKCLRDQSVREEKAKRVGTFLLILYSTHLVHRDLGGRWRHGGAFTTRTSCHYWVPHARTGSGLHQP